MHNLEFLTEKSKYVRRSLFEKFVATKQGHPGSVFSMTDIAVALYYGGFVRQRHDKKGFRDKVIISKGHATSTLFPILTDLGVIPIEEWNNWGNGNSLLRVFGNTSIPGIDCTSGSLGHGLGIAAGYGLSFKRDKSDQRVYVIISEGELYEGSSWESLLFIAHHKLDNVHIIIDRNHLMILGKTEDCISLESIEDKVASFNIETKSCNGHDLPQLLNTFEAMTKSDKPTCMVAYTTKGKGVSLMENKAHWHYWNPMTDAEIETCRGELA